MQDAFLSFKGHAFVKAFLRLLVGASNESLEHSFQFEPFLANEDFIANKKEEFLARVVYHVETTELASAPTIEVLNFSAVSIEKAESEMFEKVKSLSSTPSIPSVPETMKVQRTRAESDATAGVLVSRRTASVGARPRLKKKLKKKKRKEDDKRGGKAKSLEWKFIRAARYARKNALAVSETVQLIKLHALFMQSTRGDCPIVLSAKQTEQTGDSASTFEGKDPLGALKRAKVGR